MCSYNNTIINYNKAPPKVGWKRLDPKKYPMPVATDANGKSGVVTHHRTLLGTKKDMDDIAKAVAKVVENIGELNPEGPKAARKKYRSLTSAMGI